MECTQRLECTQELYATQSERTTPDQIGFLGICGTKYPIQKGPNKIGRDPQTCNVVLNLNSVSRQHAVINILNGNEFMLMDLDSANRTKLMGKAIKPYIPHPLKNGDTVQFGDNFGIFRLLEEDDNLPMTQALDIPDTPVFNRHASRLNNVAVTTIPESPDVSDKDDSFIVPSQPKPDNKFKSPSNKFIRPSARTISIQPVGSNKIDNIFWNSSKKSTSLDLNDSSSSFNDSSTKANDTSTDGNNDINEMETQPPLPTSHRESTDSIYSAATQIPPGYEISPSTHNMNTQLPEIAKDNLSIYDMNTQLPEVTKENRTIHDMNTQLPEIVKENLPRVCKINDQQDMHFDLFSANKENETSHNAETLCKGAIETGNTIFEANTQLPSAEDHIHPVVNNNSIFEANTQLPTVENNIDTVANKSNDSIYNAATQLLVNEKVAGNSVKSDTMIKERRLSDEEILFDEIDSQSFDDDFYSQPLLPETSPKRDIEINLSQNDRVEEVAGCDMPEKRSVRIDSDSSTDCEDIEILPTQKLTENNKKSTGDDETDCEDEKESSVSKQIPSFDEMLTQVINIDEERVASPSKEKDVANETAADIEFEDMPTQILHEDLPKKDIKFEDLATQVLKTEAEYSQEMTPFKIPLHTPTKAKKKYATPSPVNRTPTPAISKATTSVKNDDELYYAATQDIIDDLCTQREFCPEKVISVNNSVNNNVEFKSPKEKLPVDTKYLREPLNSEGEEKINNFVANLSSSQIREVIGANLLVAAPRREPSDPSDSEVTPIKIRPFKLAPCDLPNSQEIKTSSTLNHKSVVTESSSESEEEQDSQDGTPILFYKKIKKPQNTAKIDLSKKFDANMLPARVLTRVRKPPPKLLDSDENSIKKSKRFLQSKLWADTDVEIDSEIILENLSRLKNKSEKKSRRGSTKAEDSKNETNTTITSNVSVTSDKITGKNRLGTEEVKPEKPRTEKVKKETASRKKAKHTNDEESNRSKEKDDTGKESNRSRDNDRITKESNRSKEKDDTAKESNRSRDNGRVAKESNRSKEKDDTAKESNRSKDNGRVAKESNRSKDNGRVAKEGNRWKEKAKQNNISKEKDSKESKISKEKADNTKKNNKSKEKVDNDKESSKRQVQKEPTKDRDIKKENLPDPEEAAATKSLINALLSTSKGTKRTNTILNYTVPVQRARSTRGKSKKDEDISKSHQEDVDKRKRGRAKQAEKEETDSSTEKVAEVRRSERQRTVKKLDIYDGSKISKRLEQSLVYSVSSASGSGTDSPRSLKRPSDNEDGAPYSKRTRSAAGVSSRAPTPAAVAPQRVLFTAFPYEEVKPLLEGLGAVCVDSVDDCTVLATLQIKRTLKLLCAVGLGRPVVGRQWVQACATARAIVDPWQHIIKDAESEKRFGFDLRRTLCGRRGFLKGYHVSATPSVKPEAAEMRLIVECSGGSWKAQKPNWICVSCMSDKAHWPALRQQGATIVSSEFILSGVLKQKVDIESTRLG